MSQNRALVIFYNILPEDGVACSYNLRAEVENKRERSKQQQTEKRKRTFAAIWLAGGLVARLALTTK